MNEFIDKPWVVNSKNYKLILIIFVLFFLLLCSTQVFASLPEEITIPSTWSPSGIKNYNILGNTYVSREYSVWDPENEFAGFVYVVTKLYNPSDPESEVIIPDEDELRAVTLYAFYEDSAWLSSSGSAYWLGQRDNFIDMYEVYNPNNDDFVNALFFVSNILFEVGGLMLVGPIAGISTLNIAKTVISLGSDIMDFIKAMHENPGTNELKYAIQAIADMDPDEKVALESQIGPIEDYITRGSTYDIIGGVLSSSDLLLSLHSFATTGSEIVENIKAASNPILAQTSYGEVAIKSATHLAVASSLLLTMDMVLYEGVDDINVWFTRCVKQGNLHAGVGSVICQSIADDLNELETITDPIEFELKLSSIIRKVLYFYAIYYELTANVSNYGHLINDTHGFLSPGDLAIKDLDLDNIDNILDDAEQYLHDAMYEAKKMTEDYNYLISKGINSYGISILPSGGDPSCTVTTTWGVSGQVIDGNGNGASGATINVFLSTYSQSWGSATTDSKGNYSISNISAPAAGTYTITIEASSGGNTGTNSSQTLTVTDPKEGHDVSLEYLNVDRLSILPGEAVTLETGVTNVGEYSENFNLIFELRYSNGNICDSATIPLTLGKGISTGKKSKTLFSSFTQGTYTALVKADLSNDCNPADNQLSIPIYVGQIPDYDYYNIYEEAELEGDYVVRDGYKIKVVAVYSDGRVTYEINDSVNVTLDPGQFYDGYDGGKLIIYHEWGDTDVNRVAAWQTWTVNLNQKTITPDRLQVHQGQYHAYYIIETPGNTPYNIKPAKVTTDGEYIANNWDDDWSRQTIDSTHWKAFIDIPNGAPIKTYNFWLRYMHSGTGARFAQKVQLTVNPAHDAFVNSITTKVNGVEKTEFDIGEDVTITANVGVSGGYTEEVNVVLSITGPNSYYYPDSKNRIESKATISSTSQDIVFGPWNTFCLMPGNYTISVTANMGADINSGNNTKTKAVVIKELPALIVNGQTDKTTYDQGEQIKLTATVTDPNTNPVNDATVTATITWPDLTESNPALSYNAISGKYEYNFYATQFGSYTIELRAVKTNYGTGTKELPGVTVNNTPPDTVINNVVPSEGQTINSSSVIFSWTGSDSGTPVHHLAYSWKLDEGSYSDFSTNTVIELNGLSDEPHTFYVKAFDGVLEDPTPAQRSFIVDTSKPPEVYLSKTANKTTVTSGEVVTYTITYDNDGAGPAKNAVIEDVIPANTTYIGGSASSGNTIHVGNVVVEVKVNGIWKADSASPSGEVTAVRWTFDSDIAIDDGDAHGTAEDEAPNTSDTDAGTVTFQVTVY